MKKGILILIICLPFSVNISSQWLPMNSGLGSNTIVHGFLFGSSNNLWMYGSNYPGSSGFLKFSTDGGETFSNQSYGSSSGVWGGYMANVSTGWLVTRNGEIIKTTNAGLNWFMQANGTSAELYDIAFSDLNTGWVSGINGTILKTTNNGVNWVLQTAPASVKILKIQPVNPNTVYACGFNGNVFKTTNGGVNWQSLPSFSSSDLYGLSFVNENTGWVSGGPDIFKTTNGGLNWEMQSIPALTIYGLFFLNENTGWAAGSIPGVDGIISKSTNGGSVWETQYTGSDWFFSINFKDANTGFSAGFDGAYVKTTNGGSPLTVIEPNAGNTPSDFSILGNYPNPFNPETIIKFKTEKAGIINLGIFDVTGKLVEELINNNVLAGEHEIKWNASEFAGGVYFCRLISEEKSFIHKMILVK